MPTIVISKPTGLYIYNTLNNDRIKPVSTSVIWHRSHLTPLQTYSAVVSRASHRITPMQVACSRCSQASLPISIISRYHHYTTAVTRPQPLSHLPVSSCHLHCVSTAVLSTLCHQPHQSPNLCCVTHGHVMQVWYSSHQRNIPQHKATRCHGYRLGGPIRLTVALFESTPWGVGEGS